MTWIQTVWHSDGVPERIFGKKLDFEKKNGRQQKSMKHYLVGKELMKAACLWDMEPDKIQASLLNYINKQDSAVFDSSNYRYSVC